MILTGLAFLITWLQLAVFDTQPPTVADVVKAILVTSIIFLILGLLVEVRPYYDKWHKP